MRSFNSRIASWLLTIALVTMFLSACGPTTRSRVSASPSASTARPAAQFLTPQATPGPVTFPSADGPHNDLTEWWYYTGHLTTANGHEYGFEFVIFLGNRTGFPPTYASHFAITDVSNQTFHYDQRTQIGGQPQSSQVIDLKLGDWTLSGSGPHDKFSASMPGYALNLTVDAQKPPALHNGDGYFEWAPATGSYYYSRTRMSASGTLTVDGSDQQVTGQAWMDHQWGNFLLFGGGGWDWYSIQLANGQDMMLWHSRDSQNKVIFGSGTFDDQSGKSSQLKLPDFTITATGSWTSPRTGATYPSGWTIDVPSRKLVLTLEPVLKNQELDTRKSTGVVYWEGDVRITGTENGQTVNGEGYVELTGYASSAATPGP